MTNTTLAARTHDALNALDNLRDEWMKEFHDTHDEDVSDDIAALATMVMEFEFQARVLLEKVE